jgi:hypothetical protein
VKFYSASVPDLQIGLGQRWLFTPKPDCYPDSAFVKSYGPLQIRFALKHTLVRGTIPKQKISPGILLACYPDP